MPNGFLHMEDGNERDVWNDSYKSNLLCGYALIYADEKLLELFSVSLKQWFCLVTIIVFVSL
jgi:hypothetical protein